MNKRIIIGVPVLLAILLAGAYLLPSGGAWQPVRQAMRDGVLHEGDRISFLGLALPPGIFSSFAVTALLVLAALFVRVFALPRFTPVPGRLQLFLETVVEAAERLARENSPGRNRFLGAYLFCAGSYVSFGTLFELWGIQVLSMRGFIVTLPAPLSDINGALMLGILSYLVILSGGLSAGVRGVGRGLSRFSLPLSMSFRLFGALLSGALLTDLVYHYPALRVGLPAVVGLLFTLAHALIQTYVLTLLTALFYGEAAGAAKQSERRNPR